MIIPIIEEPSGLIPAPLKQSTIDALRTDADGLTGLRGRLLLLSAEHQQANRDAHECQVRGNAEGLSEAIFRRCSTAGRIAVEQEAAADEWLAGFALAVTRRPCEVAELAERLLRPTWHNIQGDLAELAGAVVRLEGGAA